MASRNLVATIGRPDCDGGSASTNLLALLEAKQKGDLGAVIQSFIEQNLGASINVPNIVYAYDTINVVFDAVKFRSNLNFRATDTIDVAFSPFRGKTLGAFIFGELKGEDLSASLIATFPLPRVSPTTTTITSADLRAGKELNIQEIKLELEGSLLEYFYVNGMEQAFIQDANEDWKINISGFQPIAENILGDFASARVCQLGNISSFSSIDEAVRSCIEFILGVNQQQNMSAQITGTGGASGLNATISLLVPGVNIGDVSAEINQVFDESFMATISGSL